MHCVLDSENAEERIVLYRGDPVPFYSLTYEDDWNIVIIDTEKYFSENIFRIREADHVCWKRK